MIYKSAIIGCGRIGCGFDDDPKRKYISTHAGAYSKNPHIRLVALCDTDTERLKKYSEKFCVPKVYTEYKEMFKNEDIDILSICTWSSTHLELVKEAVKHNIKMIVCEKPIATTLADAKEMADLCKEKKIILLIDHQRRFDKTHKKIKEFIQNKNLGEIQQAGFYYTAGIANTGSHVFDSLRFLFGDVKWVQAEYSQNKSPNPDDLNIDGMIKFKTGLLCTVQACDNRNALIFEMNIIGTKGRLIITHSGFDMDFYSVRESDLFSGYKEFYPEKCPIEKEIPRDFMVYMVEHIIGCLENKERPCSTGDDGYAALELICAFYESANENGKRVCFPLAESKIIINSR